MKKYLLEIKCRTDYDNEIVSTNIISSDDLEEIMQEIEVVKKLQESYNETFRNEVPYFDKLPSYAQVYGRLFIGDYNEPKEVVEWRESISKEDLDKFENFDDRLPFITDETVCYIVSVNAYEIVNSTPIKLL